MIDYTKKVIFIHVHKVAGQSITRSIEDNYIPKIFQRNKHLRWNYKKYVLSNSLIAKNNYITKHSTAKEYKYYLKGEYESFFKFAFVRNPLDWQVSMYFYMKGVDSHPQHNLIKGMSFNQYIEWRCTKELNFQTDYLLDDKNNFLVDYVGKYENLNKDISIVSRETGLKFDLPHLNKSGHKHFLEYYDSESKELVYKYFKKDFEILSY
jgi:hypothetical protein